MQKYVRKGIDPEKLADKWASAYLYKIQNNLGNVRDDLDENVRNQVQNMNLGAEIVKQTLDAASPGKAMELLAGIVNVAAPLPGDIAKLDVEFRIPVAIGAYILVGLKGTAARGLSGAINAAPVTDTGKKDRTELRMDVLIGFGGTAGGLFEIDGSVGLFVRAAGADTIKAVRAMSYGMYRQLGKRSKKLAANWAGALTAQGSDEGENQRAERWAAMMEAEAFGDTQGQVDIGTSARLRANVAAHGLVDAKAAVSLARFRRYDKNIIEDNIKDLKEAEEKEEEKAVNPGVVRPVIALGKSPGSKKAAKDRKEAIKGQALKAFSINLSASSKSFGLGGGIKFSLAWDAKKTIKACDLSITAEYALGTYTDISKIAAQGANGVKNAVGKITEILKDNQKASGDASKLQVAAGWLETLGPSIAVAIRSGVEEKLAELYSKELSEGRMISKEEKETLFGKPRPPGKVQVGNTFKKVRLTATLGLKKEKVIIRVELDEVDQLKAEIPDVGIATIKVNLEKSRRMGAINFEYDPSSGKTDKNTYLFVNK